MLVAGCVSNPGSIRAFCETHELKKYSDAEIDAMSDENVRRNVKDNDFGITYCGWEL